MGLIGGIILGAIEGGIASSLMDEKSGMLKCIVLGLIGGTVGGFIFKLAGLAATGLIGNLVVSTIGACVCIWIGRKLFESDK